MDASIIVAVIVGFVSIVTTIITVTSTTKNTRDALRAQHDETLLELKNQNKISTMKMEALQSKVNDLSEKVEKHNNFDRRLIAIETQLACQSNDGK